jgi:hypothetical protein
VHELRRVRGEVPGEVHRHRDAGGIDEERVIAKIIVDFNRALMTRLAAHEHCLEIF